MALPFDLKSLRVVGPPVRVLDNVRKEQTYDAGQFGIAADGTFIYASGGNGDFGKLALVNATGQVDTLPYPRAVYRSIRISPQGDLVYAKIIDETGGWKQVTLDAGTTRIHDLNQKTFTGTRVVFRVFDDGAVLMGDNVSGASWLVSRETDSKQVIDSGPSFRGPLQADMDPARKVYVRATNSGKMTMRRLGADTTALTFSEEGSDVRVSPDARWLAFTTANSLAIAVSSVPPAGDVHQVSSGSAEQPIWSASGNSLYFRQGRRIWKADVSTANGFHVNSVSQVLDAPLIRVRGTSYDVTRDGRLLVVLGTPELSLPSLNVITGFGTRLTRLAPRQ